MYKENCVNSHAPIEFCLYCGKEVHTCERNESVNNSYLCPVHPNGFEDKYGNWFCNDVCYKEAEIIKKKLEEITPSNEELLKMVAQTSGRSNWLNLLGDMQHNESVDGNDIVREVDLHKFKILWSFENNSQAREAFKQWGEQYDEYYNNPENYKDQV